MKRLNLFGMGLLSLVLSACATTDSGQPVVKKEIKDVSFQARKDDESPRKRLMILPFLDENEARPQKLRDEARSEFIKELNKKGEVIVVDSRDLKQDFSKSVHKGQYKLEDIAKEAKDLGVAALLEGKVEDLKVKRKADAVGVFRQMKTTFEAQVRVRIASARSGKELFNTLKTVTIEESNVRVSENASADRFFEANPEILENLLKEAFLDFTPQITDAMSKMSWEGRIAGISGDRVFLNVGRVSGLQVGDILKVSEDGDEIYDPQSGNYIGKVPGRLKGTLEVVSYFGQDGCIAIVHSGAGFKENDRIELY
jgi:TolB-like protein